MKCCTFIGHKNSSIEIFDKLYKEIEKIIIDSGVEVFYVGTQGNFDKIVYRALVELEKNYNIKFFVVLSYLNIKKNDVYYDLEKTIYPETLEKTPLRYAISKRNEYMINKSQYMICCVDNKFSNSYNFVKLALKKNLKVINIGMYNIN